MVPLHGIAIALIALLAGPVAAQETGELASLINAYRGAPQVCEGRRTVPAGPLAANDVLTQVRFVAGGNLQDALKERGYQAARAQSINVSGPKHASAVIEFMKPRYCGPLLSPQFAEIGIARDGDAWHIVLARPVLSPNLGDVRESAKAILRLTNAARAQPRTCGTRRFNAAPRLTEHPQLDAAALVHSRDMADHNYFDHRAKDGSLPGERAVREGYAWRGVGENIATGQGSPEQAMAAWLTSPEHCVNIMDASFTQMGAAYAVNPKSDSTIYWTQVFGTPR